MFLRTRIIPDSSLAVCYNRRESRRAVFFHIPPGQSLKDIQTHAAVTLTLIRALVG